MITTELVKAVKAKGCVIDDSARFLLAPTFSMLKSCTFILEDYGYCMRFEEEEDTSVMPWQAMLCKVPAGGFNHI